MLKGQTTKQWLYSIRAVCRRKRSILHEIAGIKEERDTIFDTSHTLYGEEAKAAVKPSSISDPTFKKALQLCDRLEKRLDALLFELERWDLEIQQARDEINHCFEEMEISVQEYEAIFYYFFECMTNDEVALEMNYSVDYVSELKSKGIKKIRFS